VVDGSLAFTCVSAAVVVTIVLLFVVPMVERVFQDFRTQLPTGTVVLLWFSRFCRGGGIVLVWLVLMTPPFVGPLIDPPREEGRRVFRPTRLALTLFLAVFFGWIIFALFTPYARMIDSAANMK
jgi:type II secretory pathway component PulF